MFPDTALILAAPCDIHRTFRTRARESCEVITAAPFTSKFALVHIHFLHAIVEEIYTLRGHLIDEHFGKRSEGAKELSKGQKYDLYMHCKFF